MGLSPKAILLTGAALWVALPAAAQDTIELEAIRVESAGAQEVLGTTEITEEDLSVRNPQTTADVFSGDSSVAVSGGAAIAQKVFVNGIEESMLSVTIDGARQNKSAFHHTGNILFDPFLLKRVEVSSGIAPADAGPGALAGTIAYETADARDLLDAGRSFGARSTLSYGSNANTLRAGATIYGVQGGFEYLLSAVRTTGDDYADGDGNTVPGTEADTLALTGKIAFTTAGGQRFEFAADHTTDTGLRAMQLGAGGLYYARPDFAGVVGRPSVYREAKSQRDSYSLTWTDESPDGAWAPWAQLAYNEQLTEAGAAIGTNTSLSGTFRNDFQVMGGVLSAGVDFFHDTAEGHGPLNVGASKETLQNIGAFAQMRQDIGDRLSLSYGLRVDAQRFELADGTELEDAGISANAAADIRLTDRLSLNVGAASSWGGYELSEASLINLNAPWVYGSPQASRANSARIGLRYETGGWTASAAYFHTEIRDANDVLSAGRTLSDVETKGVDAYLRYDAARGFAQLNYTYADVSVDGATIGSTAYYFGRPMGHILALSGGFEVTQGLTVGGSAEIAFDYDATEDIGLAALPGYEVVNLFASYTPQSYDNVEVRLDVRNVFDATYVARGSDGAGAGNVIALNEPGRTFALTLNTRF